jgi:hypothetical protein
MSDQKWCDNLLGDLMKSLRKAIVHRQILSDGERAHALRIIDEIVIHSTPIPFKDDYKPNLPESATIKTIISLFKEHGAFPKKLDSTQIEGLLNYVLELKNKIKELKQDIKDMDGSVINRSTKRADKCNYCGFIGESVVFNGGRCNSCM